MKKMNKRIIISVLMALLFCAVISLVGCGSGGLTVSINKEGLHEGQPLPEIQITSNTKGTVEWVTDKTGDVLKNGENTYTYVYISPAGKRTSFDVNLIASAHAFSADTQVIKEPSCTEEGIRAHACTICNAPYDTESIPMIDHDYSEPEHTGSTCVSLGVTYFKCKTCSGYRLDENGDRYSTVDTQYGPHVFELNEDGSEKISTVIEPATCQTAGSGIVNCTLCDHRKEVVIDQADHDFSAEQHTDGDCRTYGYTEYFCVFSCGTQKMEADGVTPHRTYDTQYGEHDFSKTKYTAGNCCNLGYTETQCSICDALKMTEDGKETFKQYDSEYGEHVYETDEHGNYVVTQNEVVSPPTCQKEGSGYVYCIYDTTADHSHKKLVSVPKTDHEYEKKVTLGGEDCQHEYYREYHCIYEKCGEILMDADNPSFTYKEYLGTFGPHKFVNGICSLCDELDAIAIKWNFGPANAQGCTTDANGYSDAVVAYLIPRADNEPSGKVYYDLVIRPKEGYTGPTYMASNQAYIPWFTNIDGGLVNTNTYALRVKTATVCEGITAISPHMFQGMTNLVTVQLPDSLETGVTLSTGKAKTTTVKEVSFGDYLFYECKSLENIINIPEGLTHIGECTFHGCDSLISFTFGGELREVEREAFRYCEKLTSVDLSKCSKLESIGYNAFEFCPLNSYMVIPHDQVQFGQGASVAFGGAYQNILFVMDDGQNSIIPDFKGTELIYIGEGKKLDDVLVRDEVNGIYYIDTAQNPIYIRSFSDLTVNDGSVEGVVQDQIFTNYRYNDGIVIVYSAINVTTQKLQNFFDEHDNVVRIGSYAFVNSMGLERVNLPDSVKEIAPFAFKECSNLTEFNINTTSKLEFIGFQAFKGTKISKIYLPKSLNNMGIYALADMSALSEVVYDCGEFIRSRRNENTLIEYGNSDPSILYHTKSNENITVKVGVNATKINTCAFNTIKSVTAVDFTDASALTEIGPNAFAYTNVASVDLTDSPLLTKVGDGAFNQTKIDDKSDIDYLLEILTSIGTNAFNGQTLDTEEREEDLVVGGKVIAKITYKTYGHNLYWTLAKIEATADITEFDFTMNDQTILIDAGAFDSVKDYLTSIDLSNRLVNIPGQLFDGCTKLRKITIPVSVKSFGSRAFYLCDIDSVYYEGSISDWLAIEFSLGNPPSNPLYATVQDGDKVKVVDGADFYINGDKTTPVTEIVVPANITKINSVAFAGSKITKLSFEQGSLCTSIEDYAFSECKYLQELTVPDNITKLGEYAFKNTTGLKLLYYNAKNCADLTVTYTEGYNGVFLSAGQKEGFELVIGEEVMVIPKGLFYPDNGSTTHPNITVLRVLSNKITRIGNKAFYDHANLKTAYIKDIDAWLTINFDFGDIPYYNTISDMRYLNPLYAVTELYVYNADIGEYEQQNRLIIKDDVTKYAMLIGDTVNEIVVKSGVTLAKYSFYNLTNLTAYLEDDTAPEEYSQFIGTIILSPDWCYREDEIHVHKWDNGAKIASDDTHPTCTEIGRYTYTCTDSGCDNVTKQAAVAALGHEFTDITPAVEATCAVQGKAEHYECSRCDTVAVSDGEGGHTIVDKATLVTTKEHEYDLVNWYHDDTNHWRKCADCDAQTQKVEHIAPCDICGYGLHVHSYDSGVYTPATCKQYGYTTYICTVSDCTDKTKIEQDTESGYAPHKFDSSVSANVTLSKPASCTDVGTKEIACAYGCGTKRSEAILPSHTFDDNNTCTCGQIKAVFTYQYDDTAKTATITAVENLGTATYIEIPHTVKHTPEGGAEEDYKVVITANLFSKNATSATGGMESARANVKFVYVDAEIIPDYCFYYYKGINTLFLGENVNKIGTKAFYYANAITKMYLNSVAIADCTSSTLAFNYAFASTGGTLYIGDDVTSIPAYLFYASGSSTKANISAVKFASSSALTKIGGYSFRYCNLITELIIPDGVTDIGNYAFYYCSKLAEVTIPQSVTTIGSHAFRYCSGLTTINMYCKNTTIGSSAFSNSSNIKKVNIADINDWLSISFSGSSVNPLSVAKHLYLNGTEITELAIPEGVTAIGNYTFYGASGIQSIVIPDSVVTIGDSAFYNNTSLKTVTVGTGVTSIAANAFYGDTALTGVYIKDLAKWCGITFGNVNSNPILFAGNLYLNGQLVTDLVITGATEISNDAFVGCTSITTVTIGDGVETVGEAFNDCVNITTVNIGKDVTAFNGAPFANTPKVTTVTVDQNNTKYYSAKNCVIEGETKTLAVGFVCSVIPTDGSVVNIGECAFLGCENLVDVVLPDCVTGIGAQSFASCPNLESVIGNGVKNIGYQAFALCSNLNKIDMPALITIGDAAFAQTGFNEFTIPATVNSIDTTRYGTFYASPNLLVVYNQSDLDITHTHDMFYQTNVRVVYKVSINDRIVEENGYKFLCKSDGSNVLVWYNGSAKEISLPTQIGGVNASYEVGGAAFCATSITKLNIPSNVTKIGDSAFYSCKKLAEVTIADGVQVIDQYAFGSCTALTELSIPASVTAIANRTFDQCTALTDITIPASVKSIGNYAFNSCTKLEKVYFEKGSQLTVIGSAAFYRCSSLKQIIIPEKVTSIGSQAFYSCNAVTHVYYGGASAITNGPSKGTKYYYSETYKLGYWRYVNGVPTIWTEADAPQK